MLRGILAFLLGLAFWAGFAFLVNAFYSSIKRSAMKRQPREQGGSLEFFVVPGMRLLIKIVLTLLVGFSILIAGAVHIRDGSFYALLIPLSILLLIVLVKPVPVIVDSNCIHQSRWFVRDKEIPWEDIA